MTKSLITGALVLFIICICFLPQGVNAESKAVVNVVEVGMLSHGPMQPTVRSVDEVVGKYNNQVNLTKIDITTVEGGQYAKDHGITAHFDLFIDGKDHYVINGKDVTFQWFEGDGWTKQDLDNAIATETGSPGTNNPGSVLSAQTATRPVPLEPAIIVVAFIITGLIYLAPDRRKE
jgi:hypothetical protein